MKGSVNAVKLTKYEQETIILFNEEESTASIYTHNHALKDKLKRLSKLYPEQIRVDRKERPGAVSYIVPKKLICIHAPYSEARKKTQSEKAKAAGIHPPQRSKRSETE